ncbi:uncharacterized protein UV8b_05368 [Ustilaginoidea virens]|uniref:Cytidyltransferase-like domain-containing protein n=1 Tax=Ustilaginoidea virens TaxID=1159556 RepID=A0A8E5HT27_USTVR|nr:uncharacterized protein UV8b_05368 [Ustilaginoidea virens]QUC21125.1 hypothetical protein UV8b_05368 [Ustilaginoidea virens]
MCAATHRTIWDCARESAEQTRTEPPSETLLSAVNQPDRHCVISSDTSRNRILLFPGSFNPPHRGHAALLNAILSSLSRSLNIRGAIIFPHDDEQLKRRAREDISRFSFDKAQRISLWAESSSFPKNDTWLYNDCRDSLTRLQKQMLRNLKKQRVKLCFLLLVGPDWVTRQATYDPGQWNCTEAITSDISRPVDFRFQHTLGQLPGCSPWSFHFVGETLDVATTANCQGEGFRGGSGCGNFASLMSLADSVSSLGVCEWSLVLWTCLTLRRPIRQYYFKPSDRNATITSPSSSDIRKAIQNSLTQGRLPNDSELEDALSPGLLLGYVQKITIVSTDSNPYPAISNEK